MWRHDYGTYRSSRGPSRMATIDDRRPDQNRPLSLGPVILRPTSLELASRNEFCNELPLYATLFLRIETQLDHS